MFEVFVKEKHYIHDTPRLWNQVQLVPGSDASRRSNKLRSTFASISNDGKERSVHSVAKLLLLFRLDPQTDSSEKWYVFLQNISFRPLLGRVEKRWRVCFRGGAVQSKRIAAQLIGRNCTIERKRSWLNDLGWS